MPPAQTRAKPCARDLGLAFPRPHGPLNTITGLAEVNMGLALYAVAMQAVPAALLIPPVPKIVTARLAALF